MNRSKQYESAHVEVTSHPLMTPISHKHNPKYLLYVKAGLIYIVANQKNESLLLKDFSGSPLLEMCVPEKRLCVCAQSIQSCPTVCDPMDSSLLGSSVHGSLQAELME